MTAFSVADSVSHCYTQPVFNFNERDFRNALGQFATGVTVVTTCDPNGQPVGITVSSFNSVSLAPPLVLWSLGRAASITPVFNICSHYAIHILSQEQLPMAMQFAARGIDRFAGVDWQPNAQGTPVLQGTLATFECSARSRYDEGDHILMIGEVLRYSYRHGAPLLYHDGQMRAL